MPFCESPPVYCANGCRLVSRRQVVRGSTAGGDALFHEQERSDGGVLLLLIDVMGHGDPAAPYVQFIAEQLLSDPQVANLRPGQLLSRLHGMLAPVWAEEAVYVCATAIAPEEQNGCVSVANAGMPPPVFGPLGDVARVWDEAPVGTPLGLPDEEACFDERSLALSGGAVLFFSDGVNEAHREAPGENGENLEFFGHARVEALWAASQESDSPESLIERLFEELKQFAGADWPQDDITTFCFELDE